MELKKIQYFLRIVDEGSLSKAAQSLYITQPSLSRFLAKLEEEAGVQLFTRKKDSSLELTEAGSVYLKAARKIDQIWQSVEGDFSAIRAEEKEHLRIGIDSDSLHTFVGECVDKILEKNPNVTFETHYLNSEEIQNAVLEGKLDLGLTSYYKLREGLVYPRIEETEIDLVVSKNNPIAKYSYINKGQSDLRITLKELPPNTPFLLMREGYVLRQCVDGYMEEQGITPYVPTTYFRLDYLGEILSARDDLVGFCPRSHVFKTLSPIAVEPPFFHKRGICCRKGKRLTEVQQLLIKLLGDSPEKWM